ncbi:glycoside hydrolase family 26 protein [Streptomyces sp. 3214.6]|uniref:glycoside hydrolase family 26 protein n=1 Tax=Streptomyces sp. 3214.6 TaxID=1882757 RepID=UPI00090C825E|nr:glycosyl hydrolase [Streptomyces sp. 3214.6]SHI22729.1 Glycosyl hydrolase family 26 [Streptomyces sp. 3214.6]
MAPQQRRARTRRLAVVTAAVAASAALASGPGFAAGAGVVRVADPPAPTPTVPTVPNIPAPAVVAPAPVASDPVVPVPSTTPAAQVTPAVPAAPVTPVAPASVSPQASASPAETSTPVPTATTLPAKVTPAFGAYLDYGARGVARIAQLSNWLGGAELRVGHTYLPGDRWRNIEGQPGFLDAWARWRLAKDDRMFVLNVPMMQRNEEGVSDTEVGRLLRLGAAGEFDHHFRTLAERLVALKVPDTVIVLGWEMNGITYTHRCGPDPEAWKKYWNRIVSTMRSVPGQKFRFDFTPSRGKDAVPWTQCYPGDDTVDIIGMDSYDQPTGLSFDEQVKEPYGLQEHVEFARTHGKPISYPEWGLFRNGDNAEYMRRMLAWMDEHKPLYNTLTDYCPHGVWQCRQNPQSSAVYRSLLSGRTDDPTTTTPVPTDPTTQPPTTEPPVNCAPMDLGDWVEYWLGGKLCVRLDWFSRSR